MTIAEFINTDFELKTKRNSVRFAKLKHKLADIFAETQSVDEFEIDTGILHYITFGEIDIINSIDNLKTVLAQATITAQRYREKRNSTKRKKTISESDGGYNIEGIILKFNDLLQYIEKVPFAEFAENPNMYNLVKNIKSQIVSAKIGLTKMYNRTKEA